MQNIIEETSGETDETLFPVTTGPIEGLPDDEEPDPLTQFYTPFDIHFFGNECRAVRTPQQTNEEEFEENGAKIMESLSLIPATFPYFICVFGGAAGLQPSLMRVLKDLMTEGILSIGIALKALLIDGGTDSGVMRLVGRSVANTDIKVLGVCPEKFCIYPGYSHELDQDITYTCLESHHTHMVLVDSAEWGGETTNIFGVVKHLLRTSHGCAILINGGPISKSEILISVKSGLPVITVKGTYRLADELAEAKVKYDSTGELPEDAKLQEILKNGTIEIHDSNDSSLNLKRKLLTLLQCPEEKINQLMTKQSIPAQRGPSSFMRRFS